MFLTY